MFIQPCFIRKKTQELIDKLVDMGYHYPIKYHEVFPNLLTVPYRGHNWGTLIAVSDKEIDLALKTQINQNPTIDCGTNEELFLALSALRDDSDYNQWFKIPKTKYITLPGCYGQVIGMDGHQEVFEKWEYIKYDKKDSNLTNRIQIMKEEGEQFIPSKMTPIELIEYFNKKD